MNTISVKVVIIYRYNMYHEFHTLADDVNGCKVDAVGKHGCMDCS